MVIDQKRALADLGVALAAQGDGVATGLEERLAPVLAKGEEMPDLRLLLRLFERLLENAGEDLDRADAAGWRREMRLSGLRVECRRAKDELYAATVKVRKKLVYLVGSGRCRLQFGLSERTPRGAASLAIEVRRLPGRLTDPGLTLPEPPGLTLPEPRLGHLEASPVGLAGKLRPGLNRLEGLLRKIERQQIAIEDGVLGRRASLEASGEVRQEVTGACVALFALAGKKELARRLRPKERRLGEVPRSPHHRSTAPWVRWILNRLCVVPRLFVPVFTLASQLWRKRIPTLG